MHQFFLINVFFFSLILILYNTKNTAQDQMTFQDPRNERYHLNRIPQYGKVEQRHAYLFPQLTHLKQHLLLFLAIVLLNSRNLEYTGELGMNSLSFIISYKSICSAYQNPLRLQGVDLNYEVGLDFHPMKFQYKGIFIPWINGFE